MITFIRTSVIAPGKIGPALAFAKEVAAFVKAKNGTELSITMPVGGNPNRIGWAARFESLADYEAKMSGMMADAKYMELISAGALHFVPGSAHDEIWRSV